jgi:hypothetical protein
MQSVAFAATLAIQVTRESPLDVSPLGHFGQRAFLCKKGRQAILDLRKVLSNQ